MFSIQILLHFSQIALRVCTLVLFIVLPLELGLFFILLLFGDLAVHDKLASEKDEKMTKYGIH